MKDLIEKLKAPKKTVNIAVAGDFGLDVFHYGTVSRISPEAPVPVLLKEREEIRLGLAGNVVANLASLNDSFSSRILAFGCRGEDSMGRMLSEKIHEITKFNGVSGSYLYTKHGGKTTVKNRYIVGNQQLLRVDDEEINNFKIDVSAILFKNEMNKALILQDYSKGFLSKKLIREFIEIANENNVLILTDPNINTDPNNYKNSTIITPNVQEAKRMVYRLYPGYNDKLSVERLAEILKEKLNLKMVLITESENGMTLLDEENNFHKFPALCKDVKDVIGAGDTVIAALAVSMANGFSIDEACWIASAAAGVVVGKSGTSTVNTEEIIKELERF